ncbi:hypothetical protein [Rhizobium leguminosarum]|uniref:hypothetical protein n=1 Tax=Rhizobium leguminosarum TaxID=384 RepID=UPI003F9A0CAF
MSKYSSGFQTGLLALAVYWTYRFGLKGPEPIPFRDIVLTFALTALATLIGQAIVEIRLGKIRRGTPEYRRQAWLLIMVFAAASIVGILFHRFFFDGSQNELQPWEMRMYWGLVVVLGFLVNGFVTAAKKLAGW